jgi:hypothetical protein
MPTMTFRHLINFLLPRAATSPANPFDVTSARMFIDTHELTGFFIHTCTEHAAGNISEGYTKPQHGTVAKTIIFADGTTIESVAEETRQYKDSKTAAEVHFPNSEVYAYFELIAHAAYALRWLLSASPGDTKRFMLTNEGYEYIVAHHLWEDDTYQLTPDTQGGYVAEVRNLSAVHEPMAVES